MPDLTEKEKRTIFEEMRQRERDNRKRRRPNYSTISVKEARSLGYRAVTSAYSTRQFDQCGMLDKCIADFNGCDIKLVRVGVRKNMIEVWRKIWDRQTAPKKVQPIKPQERVTPASEFLARFIGELLTSIAP